MALFSTIGAVGILALSLGTSCQRSATSEHHEAVGAESLTDSPTPSVVSSFRDGDLIFQESTSSQSEMVRVLTGSRWTHMGVILKEPSGVVVLEAASPVRKTMLQSWIARGRDQRYVVKRLRDADSKLSPSGIENLRELSTTWLGRPYDPRFQWDDRSLYCSELAYKVLERAAGARVGKLQRAADMNLDDERVQRALRKRFVGNTFDPAETVVTPDSMFNDEQLFEVFP